MAPTSTPERAVPLGLIQTFVDEFHADPRFVIAQNGLTSTHWRHIVCNRREIARQTHAFSKKLPDMDACNQNETGRCWLFATATLMRRALQAKYNLDKDFEISQNFFFFWDKFEKCNYFLENILATASESVDSRVVAHFLAEPTTDGGQWDMAVNVVNKYGACPKNVYGESFQTLDTDRLNFLLGAKLRDFAKALREMHAAGATADAMQAAKRPMLQLCHRILAIHLGTPPTEFDFEVHAKDESHIRVARMTPRTFLSTVVPIDVNDYVSIVHDPRHAFDTILTVDRLGNVVEGNPIRYLNVPSDDLWKCAKAQLDANVPVWFGCDCDADSELDAHGIYSTTLYDLDAVFGTTLALDKRERMRYHNGAMTHAMVFVGYNCVGSDARPVAWKVENSWGPKRGAKGFDVMTADWFDQHMYQVVVRKQFLKPRHVAIWENGVPLVLPVWDPMGNCLQ
ncbi:hypothetical protein H310_13555 [Aphanomyces invadans]|uniref:bleomycin hydrolase n=1 Tax=Aphanomyces invadans TaxID=157072 RepID=A0A024TCZ0_9STRA|nr:hypothetical protein H310_13555 [Aphanomyces invadans]ETV92030.1 hypothetical protein H310_13555 [Aphanomyces invadans]|eukprot:XP_008879327.1 hypothetical protein H310_13555 [Aphanomyces invadans]